jgi:hypothetical protein
MEAIETKFHGPTDTRGSRISATWMETGGRVYASYDHALDAMGNHEVAAKALLVKAGRGDRKLSPGATKTGYVWILK